MVHYLKIIKIKWIHALCLPALYYKRVLIWQKKNIYFLLALLM